MVLFYENGVHYKKNNVTGSWFLLLGCSGCYNNVTGSRLIALYCWTAIINDSKPINNLNNYLLIVNPKNQLIRWIPVRTNINQVSDFNNFSSGENLFVTRRVFYVGAGTHPTTTSESSGFALADKRYKICNMINNDHTHSLWSGEFVCMCAFSTNRAIPPEWLYIPSTN